MQHGNIQRVAKKERKKKIALWENKDLECSIMPSSIWPIVKRSTKHTFSLFARSEPKLQKKKKKNHIYPAIHLCFFIGDGSLNPTF